MDESRFTHPGVPCGGVAVKVGTSVGWTKG